MKKVLTATAIALLFCAFEASAAGMQAASVRVGPLADDRPANETNAAPKKDDRGKTPPRSESQPAAKSDSKADVKPAASPAAGNDSKETSGKEKASEAGKSSSPLPAAVSTAAPVNSGEASMTSDAPPKSNPVTSPAANTIPVKAETPVASKTDAAKTDAANGAPASNTAATQPLATNLSTTNNPPAPGTSAAAPKTTPAGGTVTSGTGAAPNAAANANTTTAAPAVSSPATNPPAAGPNTTTSSTTAAVVPAGATSPAPAAASPAAALPPTAVYRVGAGDVLDIRLLNQAATRSSTLFTVMAGGLLEYPLVGGPFPVNGMTTDEIGSKLAAELKRRAVYLKPEVLVSVREYASHTVLVSGLVADPGPKVMRREAIPLFVVIAEAQPLPDAARATVISRSTGQSTSVDLLDTQAMNLLVHSGDVVQVQTRPREYFYIGGEIAMPGQKDFHAGLTLTQALLASGGATRTSNGTVKVARSGADGRLSTTTYNLKEIEAGRLPDPRLQPGDRIEVGRR